MHVIDVQSGAMHDSQHIIYHNRADVNSNITSTAAEISTSTELSTTRTMTGILHWNQIWWFYIANADITHQIHAGALPTTRQPSELAESVNANTLQTGVIVGVVTGMAVFSITLLLLVPLSIVVIVSLYTRKLKYVKNRRRAVVITQYGICGILEATEMPGVGEGTRINGCGNQMVL